MAKHPAFIEDGEHAPAQPAMDVSSQPPAEEDLGGGGACSVEETPSTEDDKPL